MSQSSCKQMTCLLNTGVTDAHGDRTYRRAWWQNLQTIMVTEPTDEHGERTYRRAWWQNLQTSMVTEHTDEHGDRTYRRAWWQNLQTSMVIEPTAARFCDNDMASIGVRNFVYTYSFYTMEEYRSQMWITYCITRFCIIAVNWFKILSMCII